MGDSSDNGRGGKRIVRYVVWGLVGLVVLLVVAFYTIPNVINWNRYKPDIAKAVHEATGRTLAINGELDVGLSLGLTLTVSASDIHLSNPSSESEMDERLPPDAPDTAATPGTPKSPSEPTALVDPESAAAAGANTPTTEGADQPIPPDFVSISKITAELSLLSLIGGDVHVDSLQIESPNVALRVDTEGEKNWTFDSPEPDPDAKPSPPLSLSKIRLDDVRIDGGSVSFEDALTQQDIHVRDLSLKLALPGATEPFNLSIKAKVNDQPVAVEFAIQRPQTLVDALAPGSADTSTSKVELSVQSPKATAGFTGKVVASPAPELDGALNLSIPSVKAAAEWLDRPLPTGRPDPGPINANFTFTTREDRIETSGTITGDAELDVKISGTYSRQGEQESLSFDVSGGEIDVDRYLPPPSPDPTTTPALPKKLPDVFAVFSVAPLPLEKLRGRHIDGQIAFKGVRCRGLKLGKLAVRLAWDEGVLSTTFSELSLYSGSASGRLSLDGSTDILRAKLDLDVDHVHVGQMSRDLGGSRSAAGIASGKVRISTDGGNARDLVNRAAGQIDFGLTGGETKAGPGRLSDLQLQARLGGAKGPAKVNASFIYNGRPVGIHGSVTATPVAKGGELLDATLNVTSEFARLTYSGRVPMAAESPGEGTLKFETTSLGQLVDWIQHPKPAPDPEGFDPALASRMELKLTAEKGGPGTLVGELHYNGERVSIDASADSFHSVVNGSSSPAKARIQAPTFDVAYDGTVALGNDPRANGTTTLNIPSPRALMDWLRIPIPQKGPPVTAISKMKFRLETKPMPAPTRLTVDCDYLDQPMHVEGQVESLTRIASGRRTKASLSLAGPTFKIAYDGRLRKGPRFDASGTLTVSVPSLTKFLTWMGTPDAAKMEGGLQIESRFAASPGSYTLEKMTIEADRLNVSASGKYRKDHSFNASLRVTDADLNHYFGDPTAKKSEPDPHAPKPDEKPDHWSREPLDWSALQRLDGKVEIDLAKVTIGKLDIPSARVNANIRKGAVTILLDETQLAGGTIDARVEVNGTPLPKVSYVVSVQGVALQPVLQTFTGVDRLSGTTTLQAKGSTEGRSTAVMMASLSGDGRLEIKNGAIDGFNAVAILRRAGTLDLAATDPAEKTQIGDLVFAYTLKDGVLNNAEKQISLTAPSLQVGGTGSISFPRKQLDYHLSAQVVQPPDMKAGINPLANVPIPISISGDWSDPSTKIDWLHVFTQIATDPTRVATLPNGLRKYAESLGVSLIMSPVNLVEDAVGGGKKK